LPKSRLLARFAKLLSRSPVSIFDCDEAEELPAGWRTSPKSAAPGLVTPADEGWPKTVEKSDTKGVDEVEEGNAEEFEGGNALVGVEEKPSNASNPNLLSFFRRKGLTLELRGYLHGRKELQREKEIRANGHLQRRKVMYARANGQDCCSLAQAHIIMQVAGCAEICKCR